MRHALISAAGMVENVVLHNAASEWTPPEGFTIVPVEGLGVGPGWTYDGETFSPPEPEPLVLTVEVICREIDAERDRRIDGGFVFNGVRFQSRASDRENIMGAAQLAMAYLAAGGDPASLPWADPDKDFVWIAEDNTIVPMTASGVVALFQAGVAFKSGLTFHARDLKDAVLAAEVPASVDWREGWPA